MVTYNAGAGAGTLQINAVVGAVSGNQSRVDWSLVLYCYNGVSRNLSANVPWNVSIAGNAYSGLFAFDFRNTSAVWIATGSTWVGHDSAGNAQIYISGFKGVDGASDIADNVTVDGLYTLPNIAKVPPAPTALSLDEVTPTGFRYRFSSTGNGGAAIQYWESQVATNSTFTQNVKSMTHPTSGVHVYTDLLPGTLYYARSRGVNSVGPGAWSTTLTTNTLSGVYVRRGSSFKAAPVYVYRSGQWVTAPVYVYRSGVWVPCT